MGELPAQPLFKVVNERCCTGGAHLELLADRGIGRDDDHSVAIRVRTDPVHVDHASCAQTAPATNAPTVNRGYPSATARYSTFSSLSPAGSGLPGPPAAKSRSAAAANATANATSPRHANIT